MFVIPKFEPLFKQLGDNIPWPTLAHHDASRRSRSSTGTSSSAQSRSRRSALRHYVRTENGRLRWDTLKLRLPVIGKLVHEGSLARIARSLSISMTAGMPVIQTLKIIAHAAGNQYMAERVGRLREAVERGEPVSRAAASVGMFPPLVLQMLAVGEETGDMLGAARRSRGLLRARSRLRTEEPQRGHRAVPDHCRRRHRLHSGARRDAADVGNDLAGAGMRFGSQIGTNRGRSAPARSAQGR